MSYVRILLGQNFWGGIRGGEKSEQWEGAGGRLPPPALYTLDFDVSQKLPKHQEKNKKHVQSFSLNILDFLKNIFVSTPLTLP